MATSSIRKGSGWVSVGRVGLAAVFAVWALALAAPGPAAAAGALVQQARLTTPGGIKGDTLGWSVAMSGDGSIVVAGAPKAPTASQARCTCSPVRLPAGRLVGQVAKLTTSDDRDRLGVRPVAISRDGSTILSASNGKMYVYTRPAGGWATATETAQLTSTDGLILGVPAVSADGSTIAIGASGANFDGTPGNPNHGAVYVYVRPPGGWRSATQTARLSSTNAFTGSALACPSRSPTMARRSRPGCWARSSTRPGSGRRAW